MPCLGLAESAAEFFPDAAWQRCVVHWYRNVFSHVPSTKIREVAAMLLKGVLNPHFPDEALSCAALAPIQIQESAAGHLQERRFDG